jgi:Fe-S cluster assembly ATPase SufC
VVKNLIEVGAKLQSVEMIIENSEVILSVRNLTADVDGNQILKGLNLEVKAGEIHAIMGPNGSGKSTFSKVLAGHPAYEVTGGEVIFRVKTSWKWNQKKERSQEFFWRSNTQ